MIQQFKKVIIYLFEKVSRWQEEKVLLDWKKKYSCGEGVSLSTHGFLDGNIEIGDHTYINQGFRIKSGDNSKVTIGKNCAIGRFLSCASITHDLVRPTADLRHQSHLTKEENITIGDEVWIGDHVTILPGIVIGNNSVIGAHAVVTKNVKDFEIVGGVPAKHIGFNNNHYKFPPST